MILKFFHRIAKIICFLMKKLQILFKRAFSYLRQNKKVSTLLLRLAGIAVFTLTISMWIKANYSFALVAISGGEKICAVETREIFESAKKDYVSKFTGCSAYIMGCVPQNVSFYVTLVNDKEIEDISGAEDSIAAMSKDKATYACGLYVDDSFICAVSDRRYISKALWQIEQKAISLYSGESAVLLEKVKTVYGYYKNSEIVMPDSLASVLVKEKANEYEAPVPLSAGVKSIEESTVQDKNAIINYAVIKTEKYTAAVKYKTNITYDDSKYSDYYNVDVSGVDGLGEYTDKVYYLNGKEISRQNIGCNVITSPVDECVTIGTLERPTGYKPGVASGVFMWPVPTLSTIGAYFGDGRGHEGFDFIGHSACGAPIYASDAGVVVSAETGWNGGYGNCIIIDHGNGFKTRYAHCLSLNVSVGDLVSKSDIIGYVGSSGDSDGAHLHFEIIKNGVPVDPYPYILG